MCSCKTSALSWPFRANLFQVRHLMGPDASFAELGASSKLSTKKHFFAIRDFIMEAQCVGLKWPQALFHFVDETTLPPSKKKLLGATPDLPPTVSNHDEAQRRLAQEDPSDSKDETQDTAVYNNHPAPSSDESEPESPIHSGTAGPSATTSRVTPLAAHIPGTTTALIGGVPYHFTLPNDLDDEPPPLMAPSPPLASDPPPTPYRLSALLPLPKPTHTVATIHAVLNDAAAALATTMNEGLTTAINGEPCRVFSCINTISFDSPASL